MGGLSIGIRRLGLCIKMKAGIEKGMNGFQNLVILFLFCERDV